jgi:uncharacterized membrane protein
LRIEPDVVRGARWRWLGVAGLSAIGLLPLLPVAVAIVPGLAPVAQIFGVWFELHCERDPARTLLLGGVPLAVCARCSGIYFGLGLGAALRRPHLSPRALRAWVLAAAAFMLLDVELERRGLHGAWSILRVLTGLLLAYPAGAGLGLLLQGAPTSSQPLTARR